MISLLIFITSLIAAGLIALKTRDKMYVMGTDRWNDQVKKFQSSWLIKPLVIFIGGLLLSMIQPYDIEKIDSTINNIRVEKKTINNYYDKKSEDIRSSSTKQVDSLFKVRYKY